MDHSEGGSSPDSRRFLVLRVSDPFDGDEAKRGALYSRMAAELETGGYEALLYDLLHTDLSDFNVRQAPRAPLFDELVGLTLDTDPIVAWWRGVLEEGALPVRGDQTSLWPSKILSDDLYRHYERWSEEGGVAARNARMRKDQWAKRLKELVGGTLAKHRDRKSGTWWYIVPDHASCKREFERQFRCVIEASADPARLVSVNHSAGG